MNVFVLTTGRSGSTAFAKACGHAENFSVAHQSNMRRYGWFRFDYPPDHIEVDPRMAWVLGQLDATVGRNAFYVHLTRDPTKVAESLVRIAEYQRPGALVTKEFDLPDYLNTRGAEVWSHMHLHGLKTLPLIDVAHEVVTTINANIRLFLKDKLWMPVELEHAAEAFPDFWRAIGANGDLDAAVAEFDRQHNSWDEIMADVATKHGKVVALQRPDVMRPDLSGHDQTNKGGVF